MRSRVRRLPLSPALLSALLVSCAACWIAIAAPAAAQSEAQPTKTMREARSAADAAHHASERATAELEAARDELSRAEAELQAARERVERAETRAEEPPAPTEPALAAGTAAAVGTTAAVGTAAASIAEVEDLRKRVEKAQEQAEHAEQRARAAERKAERALAELEELRQQFAYDRTGLYAGGQAFFAPEAIDVVEGVKVDDARGLSGRVGYRIHPHVALEGRFDWLDDFDLASDTRTATLGGQTYTGNVRLFLLTQRFQPWIGAGGGVAVTDFEVRLADGTRVETQETGRQTDPLFRVAGGVDFYLTPHFALTAEAAFVQLLDERDAVSYGQLAAGLDFRF